MLRPPQQACAQERRAKYGDCRYGATCKHAAPGEALGCAYDKEEEDDVDMENAGIEII